MKTTLNIFLSLFLIVNTSYGVADSLGLEGRWDLTVESDGRKAPSWLEVRHSGIKTFVGSFVSSGGSARPVSEVKISGDEFTFSIPPQWEQGNGQLVVSGKITDNKIAGTITFPDGKSSSFTGVPAPFLDRTTPGKRSDPVKLIEPSGLKGWVTAENNQWVVENGILKSPKSGANIMTEAKFQDFKLHVEFRYPKGSNSGVYLRGRYEVQISDSKGMRPSLVDLGSIYGFIMPAEQLAKDAGEWQSFDVTIIGRKVTLSVNGKEVVTNQEIPGITGGALDANEAEPGPIMLQGDHGPIEYRNMIITPLGS